MQSTTNYSMNLVEGTDIVNIPVQLNPNFQTIDSAMFDNKQAGIGTATEVVTGTAHAIVRSNPDSDTFRFTATGAWTAGDTMSVDGNAVTVHLSDGTTPPTGAYIIGAEVLAVINSSLVTLMIGMTPPAQGVTSFNSRTGAVVPTAGDYVAGDIDYDNTGSGLTATEVQSAIDEVNSGLTTINTELDIALNTSNVMQSTSTATYTLKKCQAGFVCLNIVIPAGTTSGTNIGLISSDYRPTQFISLSGQISSSSDAGSNPALNILTDGNIIFYSDRTLVGDSAFMIIYAI